MNNRINQGIVETTLVFSIGGGIEHEAKIDVRYVVHPGRAASRLEPAEADTVEIIHVHSRYGLVCEAISEAVEQDEEVHALCLNHWRARVAHQHDEAADARREERNWRVA
jgi:hypothetical protein